MEITRGRVIFSCCVILLCATCVFFTSENRDKSSLGFFHQIKSRIRRTVYDRQLWPNATIPYIIDCTIANVPNARRVIEEAMKEWQDHTCVRFVERTNQSAYLLIRRHRGCWGDIGYQGGRVYISVGDGCEYKYVMLHELGHVIGFYHEHNRADRDSFVKIIWKNILSSMTDQFDKRHRLDEFENDLPYDYSSIMHYKFYAFAKNRSLDTLESKKNSSERHTPYTKLTDLDIRKTKEMYQCKEVLPTKIPTTVPTTIPTTKSIEEKMGTTFDNISDYMNFTLECPSLANNDSKMNARIIVNGKDYAMNVEGINIVVINYLSGNITSTTAFPMTNQQDAITLQRFIQFLPTRNYVLIVSKLHEFRYVRTISEAFEMLGLQITSVKDGTSFCALGYKGDEDIERTQSINTTGQNGTILTMNISLASDYKCQDDIEDCEIKQKRGDCDRFPFRMLRDCQKTCKACKPEKPCTDENQYCRVWTKNKSCLKYPKFMLRSCKVSCGTCHKALPAAEVEQNSENKLVVGGPGRSHMYRAGTKQDEEREKRCIDKSRYCQSWRRNGRCYTDLWVQRNCVLSCRSLEICNVNLNNDEGTSEEKEKRRKQKAKRCVNKSVHCKSWKKVGRCLTDIWVRRNCVKSCRSDPYCVTEAMRQKDEEEEMKLLRSRQCVDRNYRCKEWKNSGRCRTDFWVRKFCVRSCQSNEICVLKRPRKKKRKKTKKLTVKKTDVKKEKDKKIKEKVETEKKEAKKPEMKPRGRRCIDKHEHCESWRRYGRCHSDPWVLRNCLQSCANREMCTSEPIKPHGPCSRSFGIGWYKTVPDSAFNASSLLKTSGNWSAAPSNARLYMEDDYNKRRIGSWCSDSSYNQWLSIDFGRIKTITAVATQGRFRYYEHVKTYYLSYSNNGKTWHFFRHGKHIKVFKGNCDHTTPVINSLGRSVNARFIRFHPNDFYGGICMRVEVFGCG